MGTLRDLLANLWVKLVAHLKDVMPENVFNFVIGHLPMPLDD